MNPCPVCDNTLGFKLLRKNEHSDYVKCTKCAAYFLTPMPSVLEMKNYVDKSYQEGDYHDYIKAKPMKISSFENRLQQFKKYLRPAVQGKALRHLDVGCSVGFMIEVGLRNGFDSYGVEFSDAAISQAEPQVKSRIYHGDVNMLAERKLEKFDVITCYDIVEHVQASKPFLDSLGNLLSSQGVLILTTPDSTHWIAKLMGRFWPMFQPMQHTILFSPVALESAVESVGLKSVSTLPAYKYLSFRYLADQLKLLNPLISFLMTAVTRILPKSLVEKAIPLNISEFMLIAKKP